MKNIRLFNWKFSVFGGEIFNIFEWTCFCNVLVAQVFLIISYLRDNLGLL